MPLTFPAHQGLIVPIKLRWPHAIDATALCIGAAAPDFAYPLDRWSGDRSHQLIGLIVWALPFTLVAAAVTRRWAASGIFAAAPDLGPLRVRSYRVLGTRRPRPLVTIISAMIGAVSHVVIDAFTHQGRWGANLMHLNDVAVDVPLRGPFTEARVLQYFGHGFGSLAFVGLLLAVAARRDLEKWYGSEAVRIARTVTVSSRQRVTFAAIVLVPPLMSVPVALLLWGSVRFEPLTALALSVLTAGAVLDRQLSLSAPASRTATHS